MQYDLPIYNDGALLNPRPPAIHSVTVGSHAADFTHHDPLSNINVSSAEDCHYHPELKRKLYSALAEGDEGELSIAIPKEVQLKHSGHSAVGPFSESEFHLCHVTRNCSLTTCQTEHLNHRLRLSQLNKLFPNFFQSRYA
jgi:hypothetical protein